MVPSRTRLGRFRAILTRPVRWTLLAAALVAAAALVHPARVTYKLQVGKSQLRSGDYESGLMTLREAARLDPDRAETQFWLARACRKTGDLEGVRRHLDRAAALNYSETERLKREWWLVLAETGRVREVEQHLPAMLLHAAEDGPEICDAFVQGYCLNLQFEPARQLIGAWQTDFPDDHRPYARLGQIESGQQRWPQAAAAYEEALRRKPDLPSVRCALATALVELHREQDAEQQLRAALNADPDFVPALLALGNLLLERKDAAGAAMMAGRALDQQPQDDEAQLLLAKSELAAGKPESSIRRLEALIQQWPEDLRLRYTLARALRLAGRHEDAEHQLQTYSELEQARGRIEELDRAVRRDPSNPELRYELGSLMLRHESRREGAVWLQSVLQFEPAHAGAHQELASYYEKVGHVELSRLHGAQSEMAVSSVPAIDP